jgi:hypothetical protein
MNKMVSKLSNRIIDQMGTLISHDYQWTSKYGKDIFVQNLAIIATILVQNAYASTHFVT